MIDEVHLDPYSTSVDGTYLSHMPSCLQSGNPIQTNLKLYLEQDLLAIHAAIAGRRLFRLPLSIRHWSMTSSGR